MASSIIVIVPLPAKCPENRVFKPCDDIVDHCRHA